MEQYVYTTRKTPPICHTPHKVIWGCVFDSLILSNDIDSPPIHDISQHISKQSSNFEEMIALYTGQLMSILWSH